MSQWHKRGKESFRSFAVAAAPRMLDPRGLSDFQAWAWTRLLADCEALTSAQLVQPGLIAGGAGAGSIMETMAHVIGADDVWLRRWSVDSAATFRQTSYADLAELKAARNGLDVRLKEWCSQLSDEAANGAYTYYRASVGREETYPLAGLMMHASNHATHHRAEVCVALTSLGISPTETDYAVYLSAIR